MEGRYGILLFVLNHSLIKFSLCPLGSLSLGRKVAQVSCSASLSRAKKKWLSAKRCVS